MHFLNKLQLSCYILYFKCKSKNIIQDYRAATGNTTFSEKKRRTLKIKGDAVSFNNLIN